jgi:hypothetical protein
MKKKPIEQPTLFQPQSKPRADFPITAPAPRTDTVAAIKRRDRGMARSTGHAEATTPGWRDEAHKALLVYISTMKAPDFLTEDLIAWTKTIPTIPQPPDDRSWGSIILGAARAGVIRRVGFRAANTSNRGAKSVWVKA